MTETSLPCSRAVGWSLSLLAALIGGGCSGGQTGSPVLAAEVPLHLEEYLEAASISGSEVPTDFRDPVEWRFDEPQADWIATQSWNPTIAPLRFTQLDDALRLTLAPDRGGQLHVGGIHIELPDGAREDGDLVVRARTSDAIRWMWLGYDLREGSGSATAIPYNPFVHRGDRPPIVSDGSAHTYVLRANPDADPSKQLGLWFLSDGPAALDILSISLIPEEMDYADVNVGARAVIRGRAYRRSVYVHASGRIEYQVRIPEAGRLDFGIGMLRDDVPITFRVTARTGSAATMTLFEESHADNGAWGERSSVDLSSLAGQIVTIGLETESERDGAVALWSAPTISPAAVPAAPNIILYVIDAAGADLMSVYGYNRRTTPHLERIAAEGAVFEHAHSNSAWTKPSTASFLTSLHHSVLGGYETFADKIPAAAVPIAELLHGAGYQTGMFSSNPNAGSASDLQRGIDELDGDMSWDELPISSGILQGRFREWRTAYPGQPYWAHFQTTDVHEPQRPVAPFAGTYIDAAGRDRAKQLDDAAHDGSRGDETDSAFHRRRFEEMGVDPVQVYAAQRDRYDETMAHQDWQLGRFVDELKRSGEWDNTILVITSDHGHPAGSFTRFGREMFDPPPPDNEGAFFDSYRTRVPFIVVWPGHIEPGIRIPDPVSLIDLKPTLLDLAGLPPAEVAQGQSLAPLLLGQPGWEPRPVIFDQFQWDEVTGQLVGHIEILDGRWGASLEIWPDLAKGDPEPRPSGQGRAAREHDPEMPRLLLYDVWADPFTRANVNDLHPELVGHYTGILAELWEAHQLLAAGFARGGAQTLDASQLEALRALGYIQ